MGKFARVITSADLKDFEGARGNDVVVAGLNEESNLGIFSDQRRGGKRRTMYFFFNFNFVTLSSCLI